MCAPMKNLRLLFSHHTWEQVLVGALVGFCSSVSWFVLDSFVLKPHLYPILEETQLAKYFYIKDSSHIENLLKTEWELARKAKKNNNNNNNTTPTMKKKKSK